jgi:hypothetical protein
VHTEVPWFRLPRFVRYDSSSGFLKDAGLAGGATKEMALVCMAGASNQLPSGYPRAESSVAAGLQGRRKVRWYEEDPSS